MVCFVDSLSRAAATIYLKFPFNALPLQPKILNRKKSDDHLKV